MGDATVRAAMRDKNPRMERAMDMLAEVGMAQIHEAASVVAESPRLEVDDAMWREVLDTGEMRTAVKDVDGVPHLVVMRPIKNGPACQVCHGEAREPGGPPPSMQDMYANPGAMFDPLNKTRAVLVVSRSQGEVEERIQENGRDTLLVGVATTAGLLALIFLVVRVFGIRLRPRKFG